MAAETLAVDVLVVGGGTGGTAAAIQAARRGAKTLLVSEFPWLGGMLTAAGVSAPDGNELLPFQTGLWGAFLRALRQRQGGGLENAWVSFFTYEPEVGAAIFADWVNALPNLQWITGQVPKAVIRQGDRIMGIQFDALTAYAQITIDGTELGDVLALGEVPHRWGWEEQAVFGEPSAPHSLSDPADPLYPIVNTYPVQAPTWVVVLKDYGNAHTVGSIAPTHSYQSQCFQGAWSGYSPAQFLTYGQLPRHRFMINWPHQGNDYGVKLDRLVQGPASRSAWAAEAIAHSQNFAHYIQSALGRRYGLAADTFPTSHQSPGGGAFALCPYYRESRRLIGLTTVTELDILPQPGGQVACLPLNAQGKVTAIAIGNYPNDHHYPGFTLPLAPKSFRWGGRWTGTPFALPYEALVPAVIEGLLVCEKNISVSHIANGATRLQPVVLGLGQAAGMAAALCIEAGCQPRDLPVQTLQEALINDPYAPAAVIPLLDVLPQAAAWRQCQTYYLKHPEDYPADGYAGDVSGSPSGLLNSRLNREMRYRGCVNFVTKGRYWQAKFTAAQMNPADLVTLNPHINQQFQTIEDGQEIEVLAAANANANWLEVMKIT